MFNGCRFRFPLCRTHFFSFGDSKDIAKDLLKGAIDLQDSLVMLGKLQEASQYMARLKREQHQAMESSERVRSDRISCDGNSTVELKKVIRESLVKQNLVFPKKAREMSDSGSVSVSASASTSESPSTENSSQSSTVGKGTNLIAKLMGLEEYPSRPLQAEPEKKRFEAQKVRYEARQADPERRSLKEILESMRFQGVLRNDSSEALPNAASDSRQKLPDDGTPIVLIKPVRVPCPEPEETRRLALKEEEDPLYRRAMLRKMRRNEELLPKEMTKMSREKRAIIEVPKEREAVSKANGSVKSRASSPVTHIQQRNEDAEKRSDKIKKVVGGINRKPLEKDVVKTRSVVKCEDQAMSVLIKARKSNSEPSILKGQNSRKPSAKPSAIKRTDQTTACNSFGQRKNYLKKEKPAKKSTQSKVLSQTESRGRELDEKKTEICSERDCREVTINTSYETQLPILVEHRLPKLEDSDHISESMIEGHHGDDLTYCNESANNDSIDVYSRELEDTKEFKTEDNLKALLLGSLSFQSRAEELFNLNVQSSGFSQELSIDYFEDPSTKLLVDCANEIIKRKSSRDSQTVYLMSQTCVGKFRRGDSLETLVQEVCDGFEALKNYRQFFGGERLLMDCLYAMLERDLTCTGTMNGIWDSGWRTGFSMDEAERVAREVEKLVFSGLIEEIFA